MGSGISLARGQLIDIAERELHHAFREFEQAQQIIDDFGFVIPESFDVEHKYRKTIRKLYTIKNEISPKKPQCQTYLP
jgi:hypothetical protein